MMAKAKTKSALKKTYQFMKLTGQVSPQLRKKLYKQLRGNKDILRSFKEFSVNYNAGNIPLTPQLRKKLDKHSNLLEQYSSVNINKCCEKKASKLNQAGAGIIPLLISALAPIVSSIISSKLSNNQNE